MRWLAEDPPKPKAADTRVRRVFAFRPTRVKEYVVWLESFDIYEVYFSPINGNQGWWSETNRSVIKRCCT